MNRAYLRRFDYAIRFSTPPQSVRVEIARYIADGLEKPLLVKCAPEHQYELWDETPGAGEFYRRLAAEVAVKGSGAEMGMASRRSTTALYG